MKPDMAIQQKAAFRPTLTIVKDALKEAAEVSSDLRTLLLKSAVLGEFDAGVLSRLAGRQEDDRDLLEEVAFFMPVKEIDENTFGYDEFTRQALLSVAFEEEEQILMQASQEAADYFQEQAREAEDETLRRKYEQRALYYQLLADPQQGFAAWQEAWAAVFDERAGFDRQAELILMVDNAWESLAEVSGAQVEVLLRKGWLAFDVGDWRGAMDSFYRALVKDLGADLEIQLYLNAKSPSPLIDGRHHPIAESEINVGLGYTHFRQGSLGLAARHFEKATFLIGKELPRQEDAVLIRTKALCGLGEVCTQMGAPDRILLRRLLLPKEEQRKTLIEYAQANETPPLEDLALDRLLREAERFFLTALETIPDLESAACDRLRIEARQAHLYLEQGDWESAQALFEQVRRLELKRLGMDDERSVLPVADPRIVNRLAWINLYLGDCRLLAAQTPTLPEEKLLPQLKRSDMLNREKDSFLQQQMAHLKGDLLERVAARREAKYDLAAEVVSEETAASWAQKHYYTAWSLWKEINMREGMALALRRRADLAAIHFDDPEQREQALHLYKTSLELYEQIGNPDEVARAQARIEFLRARAEPQQGDRAPPPEEMASDMALSESVTVEEQPTKKVEKRKQAARKDGSLEAFQVAVEDALAHRRRFFRYRVARKLERRLRRIYRVNAAFSGLVITGVLCGWLVWLAAPGLSRVSERVTGLPWALPALGVSFIVAFMIVMADSFTFIRRWTVGMLPLHWFWLDQDQVAVDDIGLHLYDHTGQRKRLIRWQDVWQVRSQTWEEQGEKGGRAAVFGPAGQVIRFDRQLRGYRSLLQSIRDYIQSTGDPERWREPEKAYSKGNFFVWSAVVLYMAIVFACPLTLIFALIPPITRFGPIVFGIAAAFVALMSLMIAGLRYSEWHFMHPRRRAVKRK
jgi:hypothetical protein